LPGDQPPITGALGVQTTGMGVQGVVYLDQQASEVGVQVRIALRTQYLREWVAGGIMVLFILANALMLYAVYRLVWLDQSNLETHLITRADRIISNQVIMALLGATAVQVGVIAVVIARYLFPGRQP
jgi:hypothetical protein